MSPGPPPAGFDADRRPYVVVWEVTRACELACKHCRADAVPDRHPGELTTAEGRRLLEDIADFGEGQIVVFSGGDPLEREDVETLVAHGTDLGLRMAITPSGTASLDEDRVRSLATAGIQRLALSLDGANAERHDEFRGEAGSFDRTIEAAELAHEAGIPLQINTTVCAATVEDLPTVADLVGELGAVLWSVFFLVPVGRGDVLEPIGPDRAEQVMAWLVDRGRRSSFDVKTTEAPHYRRVLLQTGDGAPAGDGGSGTIGRRTGVGAGNGFVFVSHLGDVFPSGFLPIAVGNVRRERLVSIYREAPLLRALRDPDNLRGECGACPYRGVCGGSRSRAFAHTGNPFESDPLCAYVPERFDGATSDVAGMRAGGR